MPKRGLAFEPRLPPLSVSPDKVNLWSGVELALDECVWCGQKHLGSLYCSPECRADAMHARRLEMGWNVNITRSFRDGQKLPIKQPQLNNKPETDIAVQRKMGWGKLRMLILQRDGYKCRYCGKSSSEIELHIDHIIPKAAGGLDVPENLLSACAQCNLGKGVMILVSVPQ